MSKRDVSIDGIILSTLNPMDSRKDVPVHQGNFRTEGLRSGLRKVKQFHYIEDKPKGITKAKSIPTWYRYVITAGP